MGIRYEKDTILNWINEMGKFLRILVDKYEAFDQPAEPVVIEEGYRNFFGKERDWLLGLPQNELLIYVEQELQTEQNQPFVLLFLIDALLILEDETQDQHLSKLKLLFEYESRKVGSFSFEDYGNLIHKDERLQK